MPKIILKTIINADINVVFDLSRSINLHEISTKQTNEKAIAGTTFGLIELNQSVTWKAKHFGIYQKLSVKITAFNSPTYFVDKMTKGIFKQFRHEHILEKTKEGTLMTDIFDYESPLGVLGKLTDKLFLEKYMTRFLEKRNKTIKEFAESDKWKLILK